MKKEFPFLIFNTDLQNAINEINRIYEVDKDVISAYMLSVIAFSLNNEYEVKLTANRVIRPNLWLMHVAPSGEGKTHIKDMFTHVLGQKSNELNDKFNKQYSDYKIYNEAQKNELKGVTDYSIIEQWLVENLDSGLIPKEPTRLYLKLSQYTTEGLNNVLSEKVNNGRSIILLSDEISGIYKSFNAYNKGQGEEDFLRNFNYGGETIIRADKSKEIHIKDRNVSVIGTTQPDTLFDIMTPQRISNGNIFRFLYVYKETINLNKNSFKQLLTVDKDFNPLINYNKMITRFLEGWEYEIINRTELILSDECKLILADWLDNIKQNSVYDIDINILMNILGKMEDYLIKIAIVINRQRQYYLNNLQDINISVNDVKQAIQVIDYFIENTIKVINKVSDQSNKHFKTDEEKEFFDNLPETFTGSDFILLFEQLGLGSESTAKRRLKRYQSKNVALIARNSKNNYFKLAC